MRKLLNCISLLAICAGLLSFPMIALAQATAAPDPTPAGIPLSPILLGLSVLAAIVPLTKLIPGWGTISNIAVGVVSALTIAFTGLAQAHPTATVATLALTALGAIVGYFRSEKRAEAATA